MMEKGQTVLSLVIAHKCISDDLHTLHSLLCTSKAISESVMHHCAGNVAIRPVCLFGLRDAQEFSHWLSKRASLLMKLHITFPLNGAGAAGPLAAAGLQAVAAASPHKLRLQELHANRVEGEIVRAVAGIGMRSLQLEASSASTAADSTRSNIAAALEQMTGLCSLSLTCASYGDSIIDIGPAILALQNLNSLTKLHVTQVRHFPDLSALPAQLKQLRFTPYDRAHHNPSPKSICLTQLTALTSLDCCKVTIQPDHQLPGSLLQLSIWNCPTATPLLNLQLLRELSILNSTTPADQLLELSRRLTALTTVRISYGSAAAIQCRMLQQPGPACHCST